MSRIYREQQQYVQWDNLQTRNESLRFNFFLSSFLNNSFLDALPLKKTFYYLPGLILCRTKVVLQLSSNKQQLHYFINILNINISFSKQSPYNAKIHRYILGVYPRSNLALQLLLNLLGSFSLGFRYKEVYKCGGCRHDRGKNPESDVRAQLCIHRREGFRHQKHQEPVQHHGDTGSDCLRLRGEQFTH